MSSPRVGPHIGPHIRQGWEDEVIDPPHPWAFYALVVVCTVLTSMFLSVCGDGTASADAQTTPRPLDCKAALRQCT